MYINAYADRLLAENRQLKSKIAVYESDDALAQMVHACENRVRGAVSREKRNYDAWMKAAEANRELKEQNIRLELAQGITLALSFKMGGEVLRTVVVREWRELGILGAIIVLRTALTLLLHWEIKNEKQDLENEKEIMNEEDKDII